ncbi:hypothetical protein G8A07_15550 [Roseateles sp. DAIF2]|uniref:hypothetical protein n=1 Tax=Roseateles sp. DAIF2 TaxID=2714952 RepID=UPI0018A32E58|nr:hypothetical protein [Roseateles sp. DAIF2]QPF74190.1 hypothetical protein G8A07_15550 [Roseateles sp. DAIF2]
MPIQAGDIKLLRSQVMDDVPEGGGAPTASVVEDAASNSLFPDISELDRAGGRVGLRKVFAAVRTADTDGFFGVNLIVAEPPKDPRVSVTLFTTGDAFDRRAAAASRMEAYLARGPVYAGYLFGDHLAGQMNVSLLQRPEVPLPVNGDTLVLVKNEGQPHQFEQYIRITDVSAMERTFTDSQGDFKRTRVVLGISDVLGADFPGFDALRLDSSINYAGRTKVASTIVADAARYFGVAPLRTAAALGDFTLNAESVYTQLVPSTRVETPIADARMNQQLAAAVPASGPVTRQVTLTFTTTQGLHIGGGVQPGSLSVARGGVTVVDKGGRLLSAGSDVGIVDYDNGLLSLSTNVFGTASGTHELVYTPSARPVVVNESIGLAVTAQNQRMSWVFTLDPPPLRGTLQISFRALGRWYVLTEDGSGAIRGGDSSFGAGTLNYATGTVTLTLGAMPDVGSRIIAAYGGAAAFRPAASVPVEGPGLPVAAERLVNFPHTIKPGSLTLTWNDGIARTATDSAGALTGDARGLVHYAAGQLRFRPNVLPAPGTVVTVAVDTAAGQVLSIANFTDGAAWSFSLGGPVKANSVELAIVAQYPIRIFPGLDKPTKLSLRVFDDGAGNLLAANVDANLTIGSINYANGQCTIVKTLAGFKSEQPVFQKVVPLGQGDSYIKQAGYEVRTVSLNVLNGAGGAGEVGLFVPAWAWWEGSQTAAVMARAAGADVAAGQSFTFTVDRLTLRPAGRTVDAGPAGYSYLVYPQEFTLGAARYVVRATALVRDPLPTSGEGTPAGTVSFGGQVIEVTSWPAGVSPVPTSMSAAQASAGSGSGSLQLVDAATFRTAVAPLMSGAFSVAGTWSDGTVWTATANAAGVIATGSAPVGTTAGSFGVFGIVDFESGVAELRFGRRVHADDAAKPGVIDASSLGLPGVAHLESRGVQSDTLRYNASGYSYLPLDPAILGLNPVRLPADGRVPIFRVGSFVVVGHTGKVPAANYSAGQTIDCARNRLSRVRLIGANGQVINGGYTADLDLGLVTIADVTGWSQPVEIEHRIEDMMMVRDVQINGQLTFTRALTHAYPVGSYVSSAMVAGDVRARTSAVFDQVSWTNAWADAPIGDIATGTFNHAQNPITVTNRGALTERWAVRFTNSNAFEVFGEHVGVIATGNTGSDCAPLNQAAGQPYFTIPAAGWGMGWSTGNVLRFNTVGAMVPAWLARTILQGPETVPNDRFTVLIRGDVDRP